MSRLTELFPFCGYAPLVPPTIAVTAGIVADRYLDIPPLFAMLGAVMCLLVFAMTLGKGNTTRATLYLWASCVGVGALYHHHRRNDFAADDIGNRARDRPTLVRIRATLDEEPMRIRFPLHDPLIAAPRRDPSAAIVEVTAIEQAGAWVPSSGKAKFYVAGELADLHHGDRIECVGWLSRPETPANPGEWDRANTLRDQGVRAEIRVHKTADGVVRIAEGGQSTLLSQLSIVRSWGQRALQAQLPPDTSGVAGALLLGDGSTMTREDWEKYIRTGVIHVLAISGQHLVVLSSFLWVFVRVIGLRRRQAALLIAGVVLAYALLTGGRPSAMRAAFMVAAVAVGIILRQQTLPANTFALAWLIVLGLQPTDLFTAGFQLSFLAVAVLIWGLPHWFPEQSSQSKWHLAIQGSPHWFPTHNPTPLEELIDESRSWITRFFRARLRDVFDWYRITFVLGVALAPQVMYWQNLISLAGFLIGPPLILLTSIALLAGFVLLLLSLVSAWIAFPFAWLTGQCMAGCEWIVQQADALPMSHVYVGQIPEWWLIGFYAIGFIWLARPYLGDETSLRWLPQRVSTWLAFLGSWSLVGLIILSLRPTSDELRITFVAVGHGGCTVLETPDGRTLLYDAGSMGGSETTRRQVAPFLWSRGIRRIDEVFLSHADLDHFNGLPALIDRFTIGQVTVTPSFFDKHQPGVRLVEDLLHRRGIPIRTAQAGDAFRAGEVEIAVLHPPAEGLPGPDENQRSMVLLVQHRGQRILLTGDLAGPGLRRVVDLPKIPVDVLMAPHHGSSTSNTPQLMEWATPKLAVVCEEVREAPTDGEKIYREKRIPLWSTATHGAITLHSRRTGLVLEAFRTKQREVVRDAGER